MPFYVLKLGGSLIGSARALIFSLLDVHRLGYSFLVVPGGGPMADLVRTLFLEHHLSNEAAHWMAILAMEQYAYFISDGTRAPLTSEIARCEGVKILLPYRVLLEDDSGLEHGWDYTSDSIAVLVASKLNADLIKATDVDGLLVGGEVVAEVFAYELLGMKTCIDQGSLKLLQGRSCWILNGKDPERLVDSIITGRGGTVVRG